MNAVGWFKTFGGTGVGTRGGILQRLFGNTAQSQGAATQALGLDFESAQYGPPIPVVYGQNKVSGNVISYDGFTVSAQGGAGKGGGGAATGYTYSASFLLALCEGPIDHINCVYDGTTSYPYSAGPPIAIPLGGFQALGTSGQAAWSHLTGAAALGYDRTALFGLANFNLGNSPSIPNLNFEVAGLKQFGSGIVDANPADILSDICTDSNHGINFNFLGALTQYSNYCVAMGIFLSPVYDTQSTGQQALSDLMLYTNSEAYFSENQLKVVPRGDTSVTGNGVTFNPVTTIQYQFDATNIIAAKGDPLVTVERKPPQDCRNVVRLSFNDRAYTYHPSSVIASIDYDILVNGARAEQDQSYAGITSAAVAKTVAQNLVQQMFYIRNVYTWKAPWRFCDLEPMDLVEITDTDQGLVNWPVRVTSVEEDEYGVLTIIGEEFPEGVGFAVAYAAEPNAGTNQDMTVDPGPVQAPYLVRGPGLLVQNDKPEIWCAVTGTNPLWGGCTAYISFDGVTYQPQSQIARQSLYGIVALPVWAANNVQTVGQLIQDGNGNTVRIATITGDFKTGGSAPAWATSLGGVTTDNHVTWVCVAVKFAAPAAPALTDTAGGSIPATTYFSFCTWVDRYGRETTAGTEASHVTAISRQLNVAQPVSPPAGAVSWRIYVSNTAGGGSGHETLQTTLPIATTSWLEPTSGLVVGTTAPTLNTTGLFSLPSGSDPDTVNIPRVYLYRGQLLGGSQTDADNFATLGMLDTELLSYEGATLASDGGYDLSYIRRGGYNSTVVPHISGAPFMRMDQNIIRIPMDPSLIGKTIWLKFLSVNVFNRTPRLLSGETAYTYVVGTNQETPDVPTVAPVLTAKASTDTVALSWANPSDLSIAATSIEYCPTWEPYNTVSVGNIIYDPVTNTTQQVSAVTTGITGGYPLPSFSNVLGTTTADNGVTWKCIKVGPITQTNLGTPTTPLGSWIPGALTSGTRFFKITFLDQYGLESLPSAEVSVTSSATASWVITLSGPVPVGAAGWNVYFSTTTGTEQLLTGYSNLPASQAQAVITNTATSAQTPPATDGTAQGGFQVLHNTGPSINHYKYQQQGDQEYSFRARQRGWLAQAGWGPYSAIVTAANANAVRKNSKLGSANMLLDPNFDRSRSTGDQTFWAFDANFSINMTGSEDGTPCGSIAPIGVSTDPMMPQDFVPVKNGDSVYVRARFARPTGVPVGNVILGVKWFDKAFNDLGADSESGIPINQLSTTFTTLGQFFQAPSGAHFAKFKVRSGTTMNMTILFGQCFMSIQDYAYGSTPTTLCNTTLSYTSTTTTITISWSGFTLSIPDGTAVSVASGSQAVTTLASNKTFNTYPAYNISMNTTLGGVNFQTVSGSGQGSPVIMFTAPNTKACAEQNNLNNVPMSSGAMQAATTASGTGSGSGGGSSGGTGGCLYSDDVVNIQGEDDTAVTIRAAELRDGHNVWTPRGWRPVSEVQHLEASEFIRLVTDHGQRIIRTPEHMLYGVKGRPVRVRDLKLGDLIRTEAGRSRVIALELIDEPATKVSFTVQRHVYFAAPGGVTEHNTNQKP